MISLFILIYNVLTLAHIAMLDISQRRHQKPAPNCAIMPHATQNINNVTMHDMSHKLRRAQALLQDLEVELGEQADVAAVVPAFVEAVSNSVQNTPPAAVSPLQQAELASAGEAETFTDLMQDVLTVCQTLQ